MTKKEFVLLKDGSAVALDDSKPPSSKRALPLCYHLFGRAEPEPDSEPVPTGDEEHY